MGIQKNDRFINFFRNNAHSAVFRKEFRNDFTEDPLPL